MIDDRRVLGAWAIFKMIVPLAIILAITMFFLEHFVTKLLPTTMNGGQYFFAFLLCIAVVFCWFWWVTPKINRLSRISARVVPHGEYPPLTHFIVGYSPLRAQSVLNETEAREKAEQFIKQYPDLDTACGRTDGPILSWQQNLRTLRAANARGQLTCVLVIEPSSSQFEAFKNFVNHYFPDLTVRVVHSENIPDQPFRHQMPNGKFSQDYENFEYVSEALQRALAIVAKEKGKSLWQIEKAVAMDVTPGFKVFSIAAAICSLDSRILFFYAMSHDDAGEVLAIDASVVLSGSPV